MKKYDHKKIEKKWQKKWQEDNVNQIDKDDVSKPKFYLLDMFPYPSGDGLHMGHTEAYTANDIYSRYKKAKGFNVLHPTGFDAFGLPAENYAIKTGIHPKETTKQNSENFERQLQSLGIDYDFSESVNTSHPDYYKWTQWFFARFFENDLLYKKTDTVNWCESCKTVLANEQVEAGACDRCKNEVVLKEVPGWFFKITDFSDDLIEGLEKIDWPEYTKKNQINWIGKSEGAELEFEIKGNNEKIKVFTTRPDTLFGATYMVLAPEHSLVQELKSEITNWNEVEVYIDESAKKTEMERTVEGKDLPDGEAGKTGVQLEGISVINPASKEEIPVFIADYVLAGYGTGAIMAVPAHDERDFAFAKKYNLPIRQVIVPCSHDSKNPPQEGFDEVKRDTVIVHLRDTKTGKYALLDWHGTLEGITTAVMGGIEEGQTPEMAALAEIEEETALSGVRIVRQLQWITAARYCASHKGENRCAHSYAFLAEIDGLDGQGTIDEKEQAIHTLVWESEEKVLERLTPDHQKLIWEQLQEEGPIVLPGYLINSDVFDGEESEKAKQKITEAVGGKMTNTYRLRDWSISRQRYWGAPIPIVYDPEGKAHLVPDEHLPWLLPEDVDFVPTGESPLAKSKELHERTEKIFGKGWKPEVDTMDTFVCSAWYYLRYPDPHNEDAFCGEKRLQHWLPVDLYVGGSEHTYLHLLYARFFTKALHKLDIVHFDEPFLKLRHQGMVLDASGVKMSKSKGNVVTPDEMVSRFGADAVRLYMMFAAPLADDVLWDENSIVGTYRFLERVYRLSQQTRTPAHPAGGSDVLASAERELHKTIKKVGEDIEALKYNTAIAQMMILVNVLEKEGASGEQFSLFVRVLAPFAPHIAEELWNDLGNEESVHVAPWPEYDENKIVEESVTIAVQVNGKVRAEMSVPTNAPQEDVESDAKEKIKKWLDGEAKKVIYVSNRLINFVV